MNLPYRHLKIYLTVLVLLTFICSAPGLAWVSDQTCPALINITEPGYYILNPSLNNDYGPIYAIKSSGVTLDGNGQTFFRPLTGHGICPTIALEAPSLSDIHLTNLKLIGTHHDNYYDIDLSGVSNGSISNVYISMLDAPVIIGGSNIDISNNVLDQTWDGIVASGSHINIYSNTLNDTGLVKGGIDVSGSDIDIHNNILLNKNGPGITVSGSNINVYDNVLENNTHGIEISGTDITISNNILEQNSDGIHIIDGSNVIIKENSVRNENVVGFVISSGTNFTFSNNIFEHNYFGITGSHSSEITISNNIFEQNDNCIYFSNSDNVTFLGNSAKNNGGDFGILLGSGITFSNNILEQGNVSFSSDGSNNITMINNTFLKYQEAIGITNYGDELSTKINIRDNNFKEGDLGIYLSGTNESSISNNTLMNISYGMNIQSSQNGAIFNNSLPYKNAKNSNNLGFGEGIYLDSTSKYKIYNNNISFHFVGVILDNSNSNELTNNILNNNEEIGIALYSDSLGNTVKNNTIQQNNGSGIFMGNSSQNMIYNNFFNNTNNTHIYGTTSQNIWNTAKTPGKNIISGPNIGGNYWAKPDGKGFSQTCIDLNSDGICDTAYTLKGNNTDYLPLSLNNTSVIIIPPVSSKIGVFRNSTHLFYLDYNGNGVWNGASVDRQYNFGLSGDLPVSGDWNKDGKTEIGVFRNSTHLFYLDYNGNGVWNGSVVDRQYNFGLSGDIPISGDWNLDGRTEIGVFRPSTHLFYLDYNGNGVWNGTAGDRQYNFGLSGDLPVSGDWNADGRTEIGVFRPSTHLFYLDYNGNGVWNGGMTDRSYNFGITGDIPVTGDWNNNGKSEIGVFRPSTHLFYLDYSGNGVWNGASVDRQYNFGITGDKPIAGNWN